MFAYAVCVFLLKALKLVSLRGCIRQMSSRMGSNLTSGMLWVSVTKAEGLLPFGCVIHGRFSHYHLFVCNPDFKVVILIWRETVV